MMRAEIGGDGVCAVCEIGNGWLGLSISTSLHSLICFCLRHSSHWTW